MPNPIKTLIQMNKNDHIVANTADPYKAELLPPVSGTDNGKIMIVDDGEWTVGAAPVELPDASDEADGKVLMVADGEWGVGTIPTELPAVTGDDNGKILKVVDGVWTAVLPEA